MEELTKNLPWESLNSYVEAMAIERWADATKTWVGLGFMSILTIVVLSALIVGVIVGIIHIRKEMKE